MLLATAACGGQLEEATNVPGHVRAAISQGPLAAVAAGDVDQDGTRTSPLVSAGGPGVAARVELRQPRFGVAEDLSAAGAGGRVTVVARRAK